MKGIDFYMLLSIDERDSFSSNFDDEEVEKFKTTNLIDYLEKDFDYFTEFMEQSFDWESSHEGSSYWYEIAHRDIGKVQVKEDNKLGLPEVKVLLSQSDYSYFEWLKDSTKYFFKKVNDILEADVVLFTGGEDVHYSFYATKDSLEYEGNHYNIQRDMEEILLYQTALSCNKKMIGICRGAQLLCVQSGGTLVQDMNHPSKHKIVDVMGNVVQVTSSHHQMAMPPKNANIIGFTKLSGNSFHGNGFKRLALDVENVWYPQEKALGIQSHPEWQSKENRAYFVNLVEDFLADEGLFISTEIKYTEEDILKDENLVGLLDKNCTRNKSLEEMAREYYKAAMLVKDLPIDLEEIEVPKLEL